MERRPQPVGVNKSTKFVEDILLPGESIVLTEAEKKNLLKKGWKEGDKIPTDLIEKVKITKDELELEIKNALEALSKSNHKPKIPETIDINTLSEEDKKNFADKLNSFSKVFGGIELVDSYSDKIPENKENSVPKVNNTKSESTQEFDAEFTVEKIDVINFVQSILCSIKFVKEYFVVGGNIKLVFKDLTAEESAMCERQVYLDKKTDSSISESNYWWHLNNYRILLSLKYIKNNEQKIDVADSSDEISLIEKLKKSRESVSESLWNIIHRKYRHFQQTLEYLEDKDDNDPDFFNAVEKSV